MTLICPAMISTILVDAPTSLSKIRHIRLALHDDMLYDFLRGRDVVFSARHFKRVGL